MSACKRAFGCEHAALQHSKRMHVSRAACSLLACARVGLVEVLELVDSKNQADSLAYQVENLSIKCFTICRAHAQDKAKRVLVDLKNQAGSLAYQLSNLAACCLIWRACYAQDKSKRELVDLKNQADSLAYQSEKQLKDAPADKLPADVKSKVCFPKWAAQGLLCRTLAVLLLASAA